MKKNDKYPLEQKKRISWWKWLIIIFMLISLPLYFLFYRDVQIEQTLQQDSQSKNS